MRFATVLVIVLVTAFMTWAPDTLAEDEVYRWVDNNGVVHFGDRPPEDGVAESVSIPQSAVVSAETTANDAEKTAEPQPSVAQQLRDERAAARQEREAKAEVTDEMCQQARDVVTQLEPSPRVNVTHEDGTVTRMDDGDRLETLGKAKAFVAENCNK